MTPTLNAARKIEVENKVLIPEIIALINEGHSVTLGLKGFSMRPFLEDQRDKAILKKPSKLSVDDVVLAEVAPKRYVLHRIIGINDDEITLRGDGNFNTETCKRKDVHGIAVGFYRKGRSSVDSTSGRKWLVYSFVWTRLFPIRRYLLFAYRVLTGKKR